MLRLLFILSVFGIIFMGDAEVLAKTTLKQKVNVQEGRIDRLEKSLIDYQKSLGDQSIAFRNSLQSSFDSFLTKISIGLTVFLALMSFVGWLVVNIFKSKLEKDVKEKVLGFKESLFSEFRVLESQFNTLRKSLDIERSFVNKPITFLKCSHELPAVQNEVELLKKVGLDVTEKSLRDSLDASEYLSSEVVIMYVDENENVPAVIDTLLGSIQFSQKQPVLIVYVKGMNPTLRDSFPKYHWLSAANNPTTLVNQIYTSMKIRSSYVEAL